LHADHISSGRDLAKATGAEYVLFADAAVTFPFRGVPRWRSSRVGQCRYQDLAYTGAYARTHSLVAVSDASQPTWRARSLSVYRFWRDLGYAIGALSAGIIADIFGMAWAIGAIAALTFASGAVVALLMHERSAANF
jgi:hypothetical protein